MRHQKRINSLSRTNTHRKSMFANMASSLIVHKRISTTVPKARALRKYIEPLITKAKNDTMHSRRTVMRYLQNKEAVNELFREISVKVADRPGGYTRILKTGFRKGDNAELCIIELVDYNENMLEAKEGKKAEAKKKTRRGRRGGRGSKDVQPKPQPETAAEENKAKEQKTEEPETEEQKPEETQGKVENKTEEKTKTQEKDNKEKTQKKTEAKAGKTDKEKKSEEGDKSDEGDSEKQEK
ncbi:MAG: 50S ribosomal protein L17 [Bacteroidales bacterium]|nr:50S ribosomal protein L17 [Bacteroidales bacterium]